jgi:predicted MFS family arabinose efflux permease
MLLVVIALLGVSTVSGQILTPLASDLSAPERRGRTVGTVVSGILIGILVSRTLSGLMADWLGWRAVYAAAAAVALLMAVVLARAIPPTGAKTHAPYPALLASVGRVITDRRIVRWSLALGILAFGSFTMFWTALTFLLSSDPYHYPVSVIGLFGLLGLVGALAARGAGRFHDRGWSLPVTGVAWLLLAASYGVGLSGNESIIAVVAAIVLLDLATQGVLILSQTRLFAAVPDELRSRANTAFVATNFVGGALGSAAAGVWWRIGGWSAVCLAGIAAALLGLGVWALGRRGPLRPQQRPSR